MAVPISNVVRRIVFAPSGTGPYAFTFEILAATDIEVYKGDTLLTLTTDYTVTINPNGTGSVTLVATAGTDNITIVGARTIQRTTDFVTGGDLFANSLNEELDSLTIFTQQNAEAGDRAIRAPVTDPTTIDMTLPTKTDRAGKYLSFNASTGDPEVVNNVVDITAVANNAANINAVAGQISPVNNISTVAGVAANITTVAGISGNVTTVAGISGNVTTVAGISADVTAVAGDATDIGLVAAVSSDVAALGPIAADITAVAGDATDIGTVAADLTGSDTIGTVAGIASAVSTVAGISSDVTTVAADGTDIGTVAGLSTEITALGPIASDITTVSGIAANVTSVAGNASNINQVASDTVAINAASANATAAANSATAAASSATSAANSAAAANAVSLGNEPVAPSIRPSLSLDFANTKALDPRVTFTRTTTATYYNGVTTAKAEENLLLQSQDFTTSWVNFNSTDTANTDVAPDGTTTADTITDNATSGGHFVRQSPVIQINTPYVFSCFLKAGTSNHAYLGIQDGTTTERYFTADFDLSTGTVRTSAAGTSGTLTSSSITSVGSGWYRCVIVGQVAAMATANAFVGVSDGTTAINTAGAIPYVGTGSTILAWGAQVEQRSSVTAYTPTTTQPITNYIPVLLTAASGVARFDHNPTTGESLGLLIEEQRSNLLTYSDDFSDAAWTKTRSSITSNTIVAPDGTLTGDKLVENTDNNTHPVSQTKTLSANTTYTLSVTLKAGERTRAVLQTANVANWAANVLATFDLSAGTVASGTGAITSLGNGWYRCSITATFGASSLAGGLNIIPVISGTTTSYTGDGYSGLYIWGAQLEAGAFPTSYIPTVASAVTRSADAASMTGANFSSWYNQAEGTLYSDAITLAPIPGARAFASINDNTANNRWTSVVTDSAGPVIRPLRNTNGAGLLFTPAPAGAANATQSGNKVALAITNYEASMSFNGGTAVTTTNTYLVPVVTQMQIGQQLNSSFLNGTLRKLAYYPKRLANAELQALTTV
jgi:hypothetical protein